MKRLMAIAIVLAGTAGLSAGCRHSSHPPKSEPPPHEDMRTGNVKYSFGVQFANAMWYDARRETESYAPTQVTHPDVSRDGTKLAYAMRESDGHWHIYVKTIGTAAATRVSYTTANHLFPRFSPDGAWIAYASDRDGDWNIYVARLDAPMAVLQLTRAANDETAPSWSPDGAKIAACSKTLLGTWQLLIVDVKTRTHTYLGPGLFPSWSPKGNWLAYQTQPERPDDFSAIQIVKTDGTELRTIVDSQRWGAAMPRWSPDGDWIAYSTFRKSPEGAIFGLMNEADDVSAIQPDGALDTRITDDPAPESWPAFAGDRIYFVAPHNGDPNIWSVKYRPLNPTAPAGAAPNESNP